MGMILSRMACLVEIIMGRKVCLVWEVTSREACLVGESMMGWGYWRQVFFTVNGKLG